MTLRTSTYSRWPRLMSFAVLLASLLMLPAQPPVVRAANSTWFVNQNATGANDGTSWQDAYTDLQAALAAAQPKHSIWIAQGIYRPTSDLSNPFARFISFEIPNGVELYGGFVGNEAALEDRNWELNKTILSGDLEGNDITDAGVITTTTAIVGGNTRNLVRISDADQSTMLDGLIITGGQTQNHDPALEQDGGGMYIQQANPTLRNLIFSGNIARMNGGAISINQSNPIMNNVSFFGNSASNGGAISNSQSSPVMSNVSFSGNSAIGGGAIYNAHSSNPVMNNASFSGNSATGGGAIFNWQTSSSTISNSSFLGNSANNGGAIFNNDSSLNITNTSFSANSAAQDGGAIYNENSNPSINNASFSGNHAQYGGAIYNNNYSNPTINNASFSANSAAQDGGAIYNDDSSPSINNASFSANFAQDGGAIYNWYSNLDISNASFSAHSALEGGAIYNWGSNLDISNASFSANSADVGGAIRNQLFSHTVLSNSIIWGNSSSIVLDNTTNITITYSLVEGCDPAGTWATNCGSDDGGNLSPIDPLFINPISHTSAPTTTGDLRLLPNSPAINAGNNALNSTTSDLDGKPRIIGSNIDLGAYEAGYQFTKNLVGSGEISHIPSSEWYVPDTTITITATANPGWSFAGWSGDLSGSSSPTTLLINDTKQITATFTNDPPTANAGADQSVLASSTVTLDGSASFDADASQTLTYAWTQTAGPAITLAGANTAQPTLTAPSDAATLTFTLIVTDSLGLASTADSVTVTVVPYRLHLPLLMRPAPKANLVVTALKADQNGISLTIRNTGNAPTSAGFWVDLYINPSQPPTVNTPWQQIAPTGAVWGVDRTLAPGESLTLTPSSQFYAAQHSSGSYQAGAVLYAIVDSYHENTNHGAEYESDESDNRYGPVSATAAGTTTPPLSAPRAIPAGLPPR